MADPESAEQLVAVERKVDALATSMDAGFEEVATAFAEQRAYTDSAFERLDARFERLEDRFEHLEDRFEHLEVRFDRVDARFDRSDAQVDRSDDRLARIERKLDQFIDVQTRTNELVERRLR